MPPIEIVSEDILQKLWQKISKLLQYDRLYIAGQHILLAVLFGLLSLTTVFYMAKVTDNTTLKRLRNRYRLVVMNDDTYEEVVTFKLSRLSVYVGMSVIFVLLVGLTVALLSFTNLKYMIPGYGNQGSLTELRQIKVRTDSLEQTLILKQQYYDGIKKVLAGDVVSVPRDTTILIIPKVDTSKR